MDRDMIINAYKAFTYQHIYGELDQLNRLSDSHEWGLIGRVATTLRHEYSVWATSHGYLTLDEEDLPKMHDEVHQYLLAHHDELHELLKELEGEEV